MVDSFQFAAPGKEEIDALATVGDVRDVLDKCETAAKKIEVDLEFEAGDDDWDARARMALAHFRIAITRLNQRLRQIERNGAPHPQQAVDEANRLSKAERKTREEEARARAAEKSAEAEKARAAIELERAQRVRIDFLRQTSFHGAFFRLARAKLSPMDFGQLCDLAQREADARVASATAIPQQLQEVA